MKYCFGVDIGGTTIKMGIFGEDGNVIDKWEIVTHTEEDGCQVLPDIAASISDKIKIHDLHREDCVGVGIGVPAPVTADGVVNGSANIGWKYKDVKKEMEELTGFPVSVGNDANVAALGEMWKGAGQGQKNMIMITLGTGVGSGVIIDGKVLVGAHGAGGEGGHVCVNPNETEKCGCGKCGCLEQYASGNGVANLARKRLEKENSETVLRKANLTAKDVFDAVKEGDAVAIEVAEEFGRYLGAGLAALAVVADPALFVIGGGVSKAGPVILSYVQKNYIEKAFFAHKKAEFVLASLGNDAGIYGAAKLALDSVK